MARLTKGARVAMVGGEWIDTPSGTEPVYGVVRAVRGYSGGGAVESCFVTFNDGYEGWLPCTHLEEVLEG